jgi:hypothetical protein
VGAGGEAQSFEGSLQEAVAGFVQGAEAAQLLR